MKAEAATSETTSEFATQKGIIVPPMDTGTNMRSTLRLSVAPGMVANG